MKTPGRGCLKRHMREWSKILSMERIPPRARLNARQACCLGRGPVLYAPACHLQREALPAAHFSWVWGLHEMLFCEALPPESEQSKEIIRQARQEYVPARSLATPPPAKKGRKHWKTLSVCFSAGSWGTSMRGPPSRGLKWWDRSVSTDRQGCPPIQDTATVINWLASRCWKSSMCQVPFRGWAQSSEEKAGSPPYILVADNR